MSTNGSSATRSAPIGGSSTNGVGGNSTIDIISNGSRRKSYLSPGLTAGIAVVVVAIIGILITTYFLCNQRNAQKQPRGHLESFGNSYPNNRSAVVQNKIFMAGRKNVPVLDLDADGYVIDETYGNCTNNRRNTVTASEGGIVYAIPVDEGGDNAGGYAVPISDYAKAGPGASSDDGYANPISDYAPGKAQVQLDTEGYVVDESLAGGSIDGAAGIAGTMQQATPTTGGSTEI